MKKLKQFFSDVWAGAKYIERFGPNEGNIYIATFVLVGAIAGFVVHGISGAVTGFLVLFIWCFPFWAYECVSRVRINNKLENLLQEEREVAILELREQNTMTNITDKLETIFNQANSEAAAECRASISFSRPCEFSFADRFAELLLEDFAKQNPGSEAAVKKYLEGLR